MSDQAQRTVRFFKASVRDEDDRPVELQGSPSVFESAHTHAMQDEAGNYRQIRRNGVDYTGWADVSDASTSDFLLIGKVRRSVDNPGVTAAGSLPEPLELGEGHLVEQAYVVPVPGTHYVATMGNSGAPRHGAIAEWLTHVGHYDQRNLTVKLLPVLRRDAYARLQKASGAMGFTVGLPVGADVSLLGSLQDAVRAARGFADGEGKLTISFTIGRHKKGRDSEVDLLDVIEDLSQAGSIEGVKQAAARIRVDDGDGERTQVVDFIQERLTTDIKIAVEDGQPLSHNSVVSRLVEAIDEARPHLP